MEEVWKDIPGHEGFYQISNRGNLRSLNRVLIGKNGRIYKLIGVQSVFSTNRKRYINVTLKKCGVRTVRYIHALVAENFIDADYLKKGLEVNHINGVKTDNRVENLEVVTPKQNSQHSLRTGLYTQIGSNSWRSILNENDITYIREFSEHGAMTDREIAEIFGMSRGHINDIVRRKKWKHVK